MLARSLLIAAALALAMPAAASAHSVSVTPTSGDVATLYQHPGRGWQPSGLVSVQYYTSTTARTPLRTFSLRAGRNGRFVFRFSLPSTNVDQGVTQVMCFTQFDTRFRRSFRACDRFYVEAARIWVEPATGRRAETFLLHARGWLPGRTVQVEMTAPGGTEERFALTTRSSSAFVNAGSPFGPVFVRRGAGIQRIGSSASEVGLHSLFAHYAGAARGVRTAVRLEP
jgi:hypothetical protein